MKFVLNKKWRTVATLFLVVFSGYFFTWSRSFMGYEPDTAEAAIALTSGEYLIKKPGIGASIFYIPFVYVGKLFVSNQGLFKFLTIVPIFYSALIAVAVFFILDKLGTSRRVSIVTTVAIAFGTLVWPYSRIGMEFETTVLVAFLLVSLIAWEKEKLSPLIPGALLAFLTITKSYGAIFAVPTTLFIVTVLYERKQLKKFFKPFTLVSFFGPTALAILFILFVNVQVAGNLGGAYRVNREFQIISWWEGFWGTFLSPGKSIILYNLLLPIALIFWPGFYRRYRATGLYILSGALLLLLITAPFSFWSDETISVRKIVPIIPLLHLPLIDCLAWLTKQKTKRAYIGIAALCIVAFYTQFINTIYPYFRHLTFWRATNLDTLQEIRYNPFNSQLYLNQRFFVSFIKHELLGGKSDTYTYNEKTWLRCCYTPRTQDVTIHDTTIDLARYEKPSIYLFIAHNKTLAYVVVGLDVLLLCSASFILFTIYRTEK